jgi:hypothetical protein
MNAGSSEAEQREHFCPGFTLVIFPRAITVPSTVWVQIGQCKKAFDSTTGTGFISIFMVCTPFVTAYDACPGQKDCTIMAKGGRRSQTFTFYTVGPHTRSPFRAEDLAAAAKSKTSGTSAIPCAFLASPHTTDDKAVNAKYRSLVPWEPRLKGAVHNTAK